MVIELLAEGSRETDIPYLNHAIHFGWHCLSVAAWVSIAAWTEVEALVTVCFGELAGVVVDIC